MSEGARRGPGQPGGEVPGRTLAQILVERSPNGVIVTDGEGRLEVVNPIVRRMLPIVPHPVGRRASDALPTPALAEALAPDRTDEVELSFRSGSRDLLVRVVPLEERGGRLAILQDVTRLKSAEKHRVEFVGNVSHELRTPATAIAGYAETLLDDRDELDPLHLEMIEVIHRNARRLVVLFDDLLQLSRLDAREGPLPTEPLRIAPICAEALDKVRPMAEDRGIECHLFVPAELEVHGNREALSHIISNLATNAVKYSHDNGVVTIRTRWRQGRIALEVIDVGLGIDPALHERIFERFYRVDKARSRKRGGTGLGLAIVKKLVDSMGAEIQVRSRPGRGSVFRVILDPVEPPSLAAAGEATDL